MSAQAIIGILVGIAAVFLVVFVGALIWGLIDGWRNPDKPPSEPSLWQVRSWRRQEEREERGRRIAQGEKPRDVDASLKRRRQR